MQKVSQRSSPHNKDALSAQPAEQQLCMDVAERSHGLASNSACTRSWPAVLDPSSCSSKFLFSTESRLTACDSAFPKTG